MSGMYVWQTHLAAQSAFDPAYHEVERPDVVSFITEPSGTVLDVGCAGGATGRAIKRKFPGTRVIGIELNADAAAHARQYLDLVISKSFYDIDPAQEWGGEEIGTVLLFDVLEHLDDPWRALVKLREFISARTRVLACIPNVRNLDTLNQLAAGRWEYAPRGVLDITHVRFFTLEEMRKLFAQTGYEIVAADPLTHPELMAQFITAQGADFVATEHLRVKARSVDELEEFYAIQYVIDARRVD
jgi:2-polyprenyl-3-methyl-5-hydroxy-6-metoxy-1,4-benzoquinol methylase